MDTKPAKSDSSSGDGIRKPGPPGSNAHLETAAFDADALARQTHSEPANAAHGSAAPQTEGMPAKMGRFRLKKLLGRGGMGSVYLAHDEQLDRPVALKIPRATGEESGTLMSRFFREARAAATLSHPNICPIYDVGCEGDTHFIAMGYIEGRPLSAYADAAKRQPERQVALVVRKIALALHDAHEKGIVHRDLKPANIMIDQRGEPIVMDFGLACRLDDRWETRLTRDGTVIGTPAYMSPEQIDGRTEVGPASDIYSLGVVFYELLTGQCPFSGNVVSVIGQVLHTEPKAISALRPDVTPALAEICARAMAKEPQDRFESMKELARALTAFLKGDGSVDSVAALNPRATGSDFGGIESLLSASMSAATAPSIALAMTRPQRRQQRQMWIVGGIGTLAVLLLLGLVMALMRNDAQRDTKVAAAADPDARETAAVAYSTNQAGGNAARPTDAPRQIRTAAPPAAPAAPPRTPQVMPVENPAESTPTPPEPEEQPEEAPSPSSLGADEPKSESPPAPPVDRPTTSPSDPAPPNNRPPGEGAPGLQFPSVFGGPQPGGPGGGAPPEKVTAESLPEHFRAADRNHDGKLDPTEIPFHIIRRADLNRDDALSADELKKTFKKLGQALFGQPRAAELRKLPPGPGHGPGPGPGGPGPGKGGPPRRK